MITNISKTVDLIDIEINQYLFRKIALLRFPLWNRLIITTFESMKRTIGSGVFKFIDNHRRINNYKIEGFK